ncbi:MAG: hypothetical protein ACKV2O_18460 [Acidimicrobiales bacterium]
MQSSAALFLGVAIAGLIFMLLGLVSGFDSDVDFDMEVDIDADPSGFDASGVLSWLSMKKLGPAMMVGGTSGFLAIQSGYPLALAIIAAIVTGAVIAVIVAKYVWPSFKKAEHSDSFSLRELIASSGTVTIAIPEGRAGQVSVRAPSGSLAQYMAISADKEAIPLNTPVIVVQVDETQNDRLIVAPNPLV